MGSPEHTFHSPPDVAPDAPVPCFVPIPDAASEEKLREQDTFAVPMRTDGSSGAELNCYFYGDVPNECPIEPVQRCLIPPPTAPGEPRGKVLFLVGDSHCASISRMVIRATRGHMRVVALCKSGTFFFPVNGDDDMWVPVLVQGLQEQLQPGDAVAIAVHGAINYFDFLSDFLVGVLRPHGASLILFADNPQFTRPAPTCVVAPQLCEISPYAMSLESYGESLRAEYVGITRAQMDQLNQNFAVSNDDVYFWQQFALWGEGPPDEHLWGNVPGTTQRAYYDDSHLLMDVAEGYLWPYLCSSLREWGFFD